MAYVEDRIIHDADAHTMEPPEWLEPFASAEVARYALDHFSIGDNDQAFTEIEKARARQADPAFRGGAADPQPDAEAPRPQPRRLRPRLGCRPRNRNIENTAPEICMFSSDYPHVEGGRNPLRRFDREVEHLPADVQERFFRLNFEDLMGTAVTDVPVVAAAA